MCCRIREMDGILYNFKDLKNIFPFITKVDCLAKLSIILKLHVQVINFDNDLCVNLIYNYNKTPLIIFITINS